MNNLFSMTVAGSVIVVLMLLFRPITIKLFHVRWQYQIEKMAIVFFLMPICFIIGRFNNILPQPIVLSDFLASEKVETSQIFIPNAVEPSNLTNMMNSILEKYFYTTEEITVRNYLPIILYIWITGLIIFSSWYLYCYYRFSKQIRINSIPVSEKSIINLLHSCKDDLGINKDVNLMQNSTISSPMLIGLFKPIVLLPNKNINENDIKMIFMHELTHFKHKDLWVKMLMLIASAIHWFNPLVHILRRDMETWSELSCDAEIVYKMSLKERVLYGETILNMLDNYSSTNTNFCSLFSESKNHIKRRLIMLLNNKKRSKYISIFAVIAIVAVGLIGTTVSALTSEENGKIYFENIDGSKIEINDGYNIIHSPKLSIDDEEKFLETLKSSDIFSDEEIGDLVSIEYDFNVFPQPHDDKFEFNTSLLESITEPRQYSEEEMKQIIADIESGKIKPLNIEDLSNSDFTFTDSNGLVD